MALRRRVRLLRRGVRRPRRIGPADEGAADVPRALLERHRGRALRGLGRLDEAQERARRAPAAFRANGEAYNTARALTDLAEILLAAEKPAAALPLTDEAIRVLSEGNAEQEQGSPASTAVGSASGQAAAGRSNCSGWERTRASARGTPSASSQSGASPKTGEAHSGAGPRPRPDSVLGARWRQPLGVANSVRKCDQRPLDRAEFAAKAGRDRKVHRRREGLFPRVYGQPRVREQVRDARPEGRGSRAGGEELHPEVVVEQRQDIEQPGRRGDVVHDEQHAAASHPRGPARRVVPDRHPYPLVLLLVHTGPLALPGTSAGHDISAGAGRCAVPSGVVRRGRRRDGSATGRSRSPGSGRRGSCTCSSCPSWRPSRGRSAP